MSSVKLDLFILRGFLSGVGSSDSESAMGASSAFSCFSEALAAVGSAVAVVASFAAGAGFQALTGDLAHWAGEGGGPMSNVLRGEAAPVRLATGLRGDTPCAGLLCMKLCSKGVCEVLRKEADSVRAARSGFGREAPAFTAPRTSASSDRASERSGRVGVGG